MCIRDRVRLGINIILVVTSVLFIITWKCIWSQLTWFKFWPRSLLTGFYTILSQLTTGRQKSDSPGHCDNRSTSRYCSAHLYLGPWTFQRYTSIKVHNSLIRMLLYMDVPIHAVEIWISTDKLILARKIKTSHCWFILQIYLLIDTKLSKIDEFVFTEFLVYKSSLECMTWMLILKFGPPLVRM